MNTTLLSPPTGILARGRHAPSLGCIATQAACAIIATGDAQSATPRTFRGPTRSSTEGAEERRKRRIFLGQIVIDDGPDP